MTDKTDGEALAAVDFIGTPIEVSGPRQRMTDAQEREAQRRSWAAGELMLRRPDLTRAEAEAIVAKAAAEIEP